MAITIENIGNKIGIENIFSAFIMIGVVGQVRGSIRDAKSVFRGHTCLKLLEIDRKHKNCLSMTQVGLCERLACPLLIDWHCTDETFVVKRYVA